MSQENLLPLVGNSVDPRFAMLVESEGKVRDISDSYSRLLNFESPAELRGRVVGSLIADGDRNRLGSYGQARMSGRPAPVGYSFHAKRRDGSIRPLYAQVETGRLNDVVTIITYVEPTLIAGEANPESFAEVYDFTSPHVYGLLLRMLQNEVDAQEVLEVTYRYAWEQRATFDDSRGTALSWLLTIARSCVLEHDQVRKKALGHPGPPSGSGSGLDTTWNESMMSIDAVRARTILDRLQKEQREVVELSLFDRLSQSEISSRADVPVVTVRSRMLAGVHNFRNQFRTIGPRDVSSF